MMACVLVPVGNSRSQLLGMSCAPAVAATASKTTSEMVSFTAFNVLLGRGEPESTTKLQADQPQKEERKLAVREFA